MANNNTNPSGTAFSGFSGGHDTVPGVGNVSPATTGFANTGAGAGAGGANTLGANLPHVDPNNFQGTVHWGPETVTTGAQAGQLPSGGTGTGSN